MKRESNQIIWLGTTAYQAALHNASDTIDTMFLWYVCAYNSDDIHAWSGQSLTDT